MRTFGYLLLIALASVAVCDTAAADDTNDAARVGRMLLSPDAETRHEGEQRLLDRIAKGGDVGPYVHSMTSALNEWANREERLVEVWITQAVDGTADERERAVRLITAMGERAVNRLVMELRHARHHEGAPAAAATQSTPVAPGAAVALDAPPPADPGPPLRPAPYDVKALEGGMNRVQILNMLRKEANASEVTRAGRLYVVTATDVGHARLKSHLEKLDAARDAAEEPQAVADEPAPAKPDPNKPNPDEPKNDDGLLSQSDLEAGAKEGAKKAGTKTDTKLVMPAGPVWQFTSLVVRVPRRDGLGIYDMRRVGTDFAKFGPLFTTSKDARGTRVRTGTLNDAEVWERFLRTLPDADVVGAPVVRVAENRTGETFLGKMLAYRRDVQPAKGGAWMVEQGELHIGLTLSFYPTPVRAALSVQLTANNADVSRPIATTTVRPDKGAEPVVLDQPEWNVATTSATLTLEPKGGGALVLLDDLDVSEDEIVLVVLRVTLAPMPARQNLNVNGAGSEDKGRDG